MVCGIVPARFHGAGADHVRVRAEPGSPPENLFHGTGQPTLYVYLLHGFFIHPFRVLSPEDNYAGPVLYLLTTLAAFVLTLLLSSRPVQRITQPLVQPKIRWIFRKNRYDRAMSS